MKECLNLFVDGLVQLTEYPSGGGLSAEQEICIQDETFCQN